MTGNTLRGRLVSSKKRSGQKKARRTVRRPIQLEARTEGQKAYLGLIENCEVILCDGLAGTGKTLLAIGMALKFMYEEPDRFKKLIMVRPALTVKDEEIGFLPGGIEDKMAPFIAPMIDSMLNFLNMGEIQSLVGAGAIEIVPISYMRGRTFNNCVLIFDEAQNSTVGQMKMVLTRIGFNTKAIIEGDVSQSDLIGNMGLNNGLKDAIKRFSSPVLKGFGIATLGGDDIVRSQVVKRLLSRYED